MGRSWWLVCVLAVTPLLAGCPFSQSTPLPPLTSIAAGVGHSLALDEAGNAWAWGHDLNGELGVGGTVFSSVRTTPLPVRMPRGVTFASVAPGSSHSLALDDAGNAWAWGDNLLGQLGEGRSRITIDVPVRVSMPVGISFTSVSPNSQFSLALDQHGNAWGWGGNWRGELGDGSFVDRYTPVPVHMPAGVVFTAISAGAGHALALDQAGNAWAWGTNSYGQLGDASMTARSTTPVPVQMPAGVTFASVRGGLNGSLALDRDGKVWAWGYDHAVLDPNESPVRNTPVRVDMPDGVSFTHVSGDSGYVLALDPDSNAWESTVGGEEGSASSDFTLVDLPAGVTATSISARRHSLVLDQDGNAWAWRDNMFGQLGDGSRFSRSTPARVGAP